ncbi:MAG: MarR family winged helix-turn-helix transcriptional regulator [Dongiaceae bacterium]
MQSGKDNPLKTSYLETVRLIERLHRQFLEVLKLELERLKIDDINNVQAFILFNIGHDEMTVGELTDRGYYLGSNVSYNVKKLVESSYLVQERSLHDRRSIKVRLSEKGLSLWSKLAAIFDRHAGQLARGKLTPEELKQAAEIYKKLEAFWTQPARLLFQS